MVKEARSLEFFEDNLDAIPFQQPSRITPSPPITVSYVPSTSQDNGENYESDEKMSPDGAISTFLTQECNRNLSRRRNLVGESPPVWLFLCFILMFLILLTLVGKELSTQLGPDHWAVAILNSTAEPIKNILI